jgi:hypothetical protein
MLLDRRDIEREIEPDPIQLTYPQKLVLLQDLAYWMVQTDQSDADLDDAAQRLGAKLKSMRKVQLRPVATLKYLLMRSGVLREPSTGRLDFIHRTFQEFLAAKAIIEEGNIALLLARSQDDQWREVIVLACGHASPEQRAQLLRRLLELGNANEDTRHRIHLLAVACLETSVVLDRTVENEVNQVLSSLVPPQSFTDARALASAGEFAAPLLVKKGRMTASATAASVRALALIGGESALKVLEDYGLDTRKTVARELMRAWSFFPTEQFGSRVIRRCGADVTIADPSQMIALRDCGTKGLASYLPPLTQEHPEEACIGYRGRLAAHFYRTKLKDISKLPGIPRLEGLDLEGTEVEDFSSLASLSELQWIDLSFTKFSNFNDLPSSHLRQVTAWEVASVTTLAGIERCNGLQHLTASSESLEDLKSLESLTELRWLTLACDENLLPEVSLSCRRLTTGLRLANVTVQDWRFLGSHTFEVSLVNVHGEPPTWQNHARVTNLELASCDWQLDSLNWPRIHTLRLSDMPIVDLAWLPKSLISLDLRGCSLKSLEGIASVRGLKLLTIDDCPSLESIDHLNQLPDEVDIRLSKDLLVRCGVLGHSYQVLPTKREDNSGPATDYEVHSAG